MLNQGNMTCKYCPYIIEEYETRERYLSRKEESDIDLSEISRSCFCDKIGGKLGWMGYCEDAEYFQKEIPFISKKLSDKERYRRHRKSNLKYKSFQKKMKSKRHNTTKQQCKKIHSKKVRAKLDKNVDKCTSRALYRKLANRFYF